MTNTQSNSKTEVSIPVIRIDGTKETPVTVSSQVFQAESRPKTVETYVRVYLNNQRKGTASTKTRSEVDGSTRKIYRQKGTGNARHGARKAPIFVGGGITFGPKPKEYELKMNQKQKRTALRSVISQKQSEGSVICLHSSAYEIEPKTRVIADFLKQQSLNGKKVLLIATPKKASAVKQASRNIATVSMMDHASVNAYAALYHDVIIFFDDTITEFDAHFRA